MTLALLLLLWGSLGVANRDLPWSPPPADAQGSSRLLSSGQQLPFKVNGRAVWAIRPDGTTLVKTHLGATALAVSIHNWQTRSSARQAGIDSYPECRGARCSITEWIRVSLAGKPLWVGPYQIAGLGDVHYLAIAGSPAQLDLILVGGDAAESYEAHLIFNDQHVVERMLYAGMDLSHPFAVSHYYYGIIH